MKGGEFIQWCVLLKEEGLYERGMLRTTTSTCYTQGRQIDSE